MSTVLLNKGNSFRAIVSVAHATDTLVFLVRGDKADCLVYDVATSNLVAHVDGITAGNIARLRVGAGPAVIAGHPAPLRRFRVQINPKDSKLGNAVVTYG